MTSSIETTPITVKGVKAILPIISIIIIGASAYFSLVYRVGSLEEDNRVIHEEIVNVGVEHKELGGKIGSIEVNNAGIQATLKSIDARLLDLQTRIK